MTSQAETGMLYGEDVTVEGLFPSIRAHDLVRTQCQTDPGVSV